MDKQATREDTSAGYSDDDEAPARTLTDLLDEIERSSFKRTLECRDNARGTDRFRRNRE